MTARERLLAVLRGESPSVTSWAPYIGPWHFDLMFPDYRAIGGDWRSEQQNLDRLRYEVRFHKEIGADVGKWGSIFHDVRHSKVKLKEYSRDDEHIVEYETPLGSISHVLKRADMGEAVYYTTIKPFLKTPEDFRIYEYVMDDSEIVDRHDLARETLDIIGDSGIVLPSSPHTPVKTLLLGALMDTENVYYAMQDYPREFARLEERLQQYNLDIYRVAAASPFEVFIDMGVTGTGMLSPQVYADYCVPRTAEYTKILHEAGKVLIDLTAGESFKDLLDLVPDSQINAVWGYNPWRPDAASIADIRESWKNRIAVGGGMFTDELRRSTPESVEEMAVGVLDQVERSDRFILSTSSIVVPGTPTENLVAVAKALRGHSLGKGC
jgi:uroporphyrinogen-III decarboxylase